MCCYVLVLRKGGGATVGLPVFGGKETPSDRSIAECIGSPHSVSPVVSGPYALGGGNILCAAGRICVLLGDLLGKMDHTV